MTVACDVVPPTARAAALLSRHRVKNAVQAGVTAMYLMDCSP